MSWIDEVNARIPTNGLGEITAVDLQECFNTIDLKVGQLGKITEGLEGLEKTGYRLYDRTEAYNYTGDTGLGAVDLSYQNDISVLNGALGDYSFISGKGTRTAQEYGVALGRYNIGSVDAVLEVGVGIDDSTRKNSFTIYNDGTLEAPECTNDLIMTRGAKSLVTKEYADAQTFSITDDFINSADAQTDFIFFQKATYVQVFGDGIKHSVNDSNNSLTGVTIDNTFGETGKITVTFSIGQTTGTYIEIICFN